MSISLIGGNSIVIGDVMTSFEVTIACVSLIPLVQMGKNELSVTVYIR